MRPFDWQRDELILALDLYFRIRPAAPDRKMPDVIGLGHLLRMSPLHPLNGRPSNFRSTASIVMKMMNFRSLDPDYGGAGLAAGNKGDREVWADFSGNAKKLAKVAQAISGMLADASGETADDDHFMVEAPEGRLLTRLHQIRERNAKLVRLKKASALQRSDGIHCEACGFSFVRTYNRGVDYIECRHRTPLAELVSARKTRLDDLALVCANCHRMLHAKRPWLSVSELRDLLVSAAEAREQGRSAL
jgi:5-methylcytosine-specific restriction protein A